MRKKTYSQFCSQKDEYNLLPDLGFEKKIDKYLVFFTKNVAKKFINSLIDR